MKVAIVHDSPASIGILRRTIAAEPACTVLWTAATGAEALAQAAGAPPDIVLLAPGLPDIASSECLRQLKHLASCTVLIVYPATRTEVSAVYEAMIAGAAGAVVMPVARSSGELDGREPLLQKLRGLRPPERTPPPIPALGAHVPLIAIGSSTGGPDALAQILTALPRELPAAVLIVQHLDSNYSPGLASWLEEQTGFPVALAANGDLPRPGAALLASTKDHLVMTGHRVLQYRAHPKEHIHRPSIDVFFDSLVSRGGPRCVAALLTGMGRDGAAGLKRLREAGWLTIAQDQRTSAVYGMPKAAAEAGAAKLILPVERIAAAITAHCAPGSGR